jgi:EAL domain-containing protein (putative c-di-GMP-specific phosphodiesterase class I)/CHASE2 domain-containing sensor protein
MRGQSLEENALVAWRWKLKANWSVIRTVVGTALLGLILLLVAAPADEMLLAARNHFHRHAASGQVVLVTIDNEALREIGRWPWPRRYHAQLIDRLTAAGAKHVAFDITFESKSDADDDQLLANAMKRSGRVVLAVRGQSGPYGLTQQSLSSLPMFTRHASPAGIAIKYNYQNAVWRLPYAVDANGSLIPSMASALAGRKARNGQFVVDYSIDPATVPVINAAAVINGRFDPRLVRGKEVIIGADAEVIGDQYYLPGFGKMGGVFVQILGAETLREGNPLDLGWAPAMLLALALIALAVTRNTSRQQNFIFAASFGLLVVGPFALETHLVFTDTALGLLVLTITWGVHTWKTLRRRGLVNPHSGLPNLEALRAHPAGKTKALIAARIFNFEEITAALPADGERQLIDQIVSRLKVGSVDRALYQGDGGIFAWFEEPNAPFGNHLDALYALFRNPARAARLSLDLTIAFGVEVGSGRSVANRLASALVAAEEAAHDGLKWKFHDPETLENASWKLSMLSQLDEAIDRGEVWVAYQPKLDVATRRIVGAEALARWTHPEKGPIAASEFVAAAEQHNRIGKLTDFVLEKAVGAAAQINKRGGDFEVAVNLSARLLSDKGFTLRLAALLARHGLAAKHLTLELTETAAVAGSGEGLEMIARLRDLGVNIAIDDYGTGLSTLEYLKKIPANEIKIDQSFVKGIVDNRSDRLMVQSTIGLAHSLGRKVVAEGVEQRETLDLLIEMNCDIAQGFAVGRPMSLDSLTKRLASDRKRSAA